MIDVVATITSHWDGRAETFDDEPDHGLTDPSTREAWRRRLAQWLPAPPARIADLGCGTGSLAVLLAQSGHDVVASDLSAEMVRRARRKADLAGVALDVTVSDAAAPGLSAGSVDVVLVRHLAWTLPDPSAALDRWAALLRPTGRLVMVEGRWGCSSPPDPDDHAGEEHGDYAAVHDQLPWYGGVDARTLVSELEGRFARVEHHELADDALLWGRDVSDERFAVVAHVR